MPGKGFPDVHGRGQGAQLVQVHIDVPRSLTREQEDLLRKFAATEEVNVSPQRKSFFDKVKDYVNKKE